MPSSPFLSIVIATRNAAATLPRCLESLASQAWRDFEVVAMDAASGDGTAELLAGSPVVKYWRSEPDSGVYNAWNKALRHVRGEWIAFLGADDRLADPHALARLVPALRTALPRRVVYSGVRLVDDRGATLEDMGLPWEAARRRIRRRPCIPQPGLMHHRSLFEQYGGFDERLTLAADYELLLRELKHAEAVHVPTVTVEMGQGGMTTDPANFHRLLGETRSALARHGLSPPEPLWTYWTACAWLYAKARPFLGERASRRIADFYRILTLRRPRYASPSGARQDAEKPTQGS